MKSRFPVHHTGGETCQPCQKGIYYSRKDARRAARTHHPGDHGMNAFPCPVNDGFWHYGRHTPWLRDQTRETHRQLIERKCA